MGNANQLMWMLVITVVLGQNCLHVAAGVGVSFGRQGDNLPSAQRTVGLYRQNNIYRMRLFDPHPPTLRALSGTGIRLTLGVPDSDLRDLANCPQAATSWVRRNIQRYPNVTFRYVVVGNEVAPESAEAQFVLPAMQNMYRAVRAARLGGRIQVSTSIKTDLLNRVYPPQAGEFKCSVNWFIRPIVEFLRDTRAPLLSNIFPYLAYLNDPVTFNLSFALLQPNSGVVTGGVYYDNLFYAILDAVYTAVDRLLAAASPLMSLEGEFETKIPASPPPTGHNPVDINAQTGHSSNNNNNGTPAIPESVGDGPISTVENARIYNNNLMRVVKNGTPRRPGRRIETYIFAMYDENLRPGPEYERHFGIFLPNGQPKYRLRFH